MTSRSNIFSADNLELCELQKELFGAGIAELNGSLPVLTRSLNLDHRADAKALVLDGVALTEITNRGIRSHRTGWYGSIDRTEITTWSAGSRSRQWLARLLLIEPFETITEWIHGFLRLTRSDGTGLGISFELCSHWPRVLHPLRAFALEATGLTTG